MGPVKVGLLGMGTVGGGTITVLSRNAHEIARRAGRDIIITHAAAHNYDPQHIVGLEHIRTISDDATKVVNDPEIDIVIELIGGYSPARELVLQAIAQGKHVVTANKALIAKHGTEIFNAAQERGVTVAFEAAVGGGIPIIKALREGLAANHIEWIAGIINGTGNFILTEMRDKGRDFKAILNEAQALGYAEADPTFDIEGIDAAHKLTILGSLAFGIPLQFEQTFIEGIANIETQDVNFAAELGYHIKHLGIAKRTPQGIELRVHPTLIPHRRLLANVNGVMNAVLIKGDAVGPTLYYGAGAGALPTASAVIADVVDIVRALTADPHHRVPHLAFQPDSLTTTPILPITAIETAYYLRLLALDRPGVMASIAGILANQGISIEAIQQKEPGPDATHVPLIMLTHKVNELAMNQALAQIEALEAVQGQVTRIRLETLDG
jgi:homoserine dehydrogenase